MDAHEQKTRLQAVAERLGHRFADPALLLQACTHASHLPAQAQRNERVAQANERLEFLGDALLGAAVALELYERHGAADEGELSRQRSRIVSRARLGQLFAASGLAAHCRVGAQMSAPWPDSVLANLCEAVLGAIFLDGGWNALRGAVRRLYDGDLDERAPASDADAKSRLQVLSLERWQRLPEYRSERVGGSDHEPLFRSVVQVGEISAAGEGSSRRRSEAAAAEALLARLEAASTQGDGREEGTPQSG